MEMFPIFYVLDIIHYEETPTCVYRQKQPFVFVWLSRETSRNPLLMESPAAHI